MFSAVNLLRAYTRSDYKTINERIRKNPEDPRAQQDIRLLTMALDLLAPFEGIVYRGVNSDMLSWVDTLNLGDTFIWSAPISTSKEKRIGRANGPILFIITSKQGRIVEDYAVYNGPGMNEHEVLFKPGTKFKVLGVSIPYPGFSNREIFIEEIE